AVHMAYAQTALTNLRACLERHRVPSVYLVSGVAKAALQKFEEAGSDFAKALPPAGTDGWLQYAVLVNRGAMHVQRFQLSGGAGKDLDEAISDLKTASECDCASYQAHQNLGQAYEARARATASQVSLLRAWRITVPALTGRYAAAALLAIAERERLSW